MIKSKYWQTLIVVGAVCSAFPVMAQTNAECLAEWSDFYTQCVKGADTLTDLDQKDQQTKNCKIAQDNGMRSCPKPPPPSPLPPGYTPPADRAECVSRIKAFVNRCADGAFNVLNMQLQACKEDFECKDKARETYNKQMIMCRKAGEFSTARCPEE